MRPQPGPSYKSQKKKWDEAKAALLEALSKKLEAQLDLADLEEEVGLNSSLSSNSKLGLGLGLDMPNQYSHAL